SGAAGAVLAAASVRTPRASLENKPRPISILQVQKCKGRQPRRAFDIAPHELETASAMKRRQPKEDSGPRVVRRQMIGDGSQGIAALERHRGETVAVGGGRLDIPDYRDWRKRRRFERRQEIR